MNTRLIGLLIILYVRLPDTSCPSTVTTIVIRSPMCSRIFDDERRMRVAVDVACVPAKRFPFGQFGVVRVRLPTKLDRNWYRSVAIT